MALTVNSAFDKFMKNKVNLDKEKTITARKSRDNLINNINILSSNEDFFNLYNDIDIMLGIKGDGNTYFDFGNKVEINVQNNESPQKYYCN